MKHMVIIGNGISGVTAARHIRKLSGHRITIISSETAHFYSRTALMYIYMGHLKYKNAKPYEDWFWKKNKIELVLDHVLRVDPTLKTLHLKSKQRICYDILIIATGSQSNKFGWPGENLRGVQTLYGINDVELMQENTKDVSHAVIVGGGLIGIEMAEMLLSKKIGVTFLVREAQFWNNVLPIQEASLISKHIRSHKVDLKLNTALKEIISSENGQAKGVVTTQDEIISCQFVGITVGVSPNIEFLNASGIELNKGVLVNRYLQTNFPDIYAIGDCAERTYDLPGRKNIEQVWYTGRMMGEAVAQTICDDPTPYQPGPWFNSAKFFDMEFQTYGNVSNELKPDQEEFYWEHQSEKKAMHFVWQKNSKRFIGVNALGIRLRHALFDRWLREDRTIYYIMDNLSEANFDPEFYERHEDEIVQRFKATSLSLRMQA